MVKDTLAFLNEEDLERWRGVCAMVEVCEHPTADLTKSDAHAAWLAYYALDRELCEAYLDAADRDIARVNISPADGRIFEADG
jgi:hypothetical protein